MESQTGLTAKQEGVVNTLNRPGRPKNDGLADKRKEEILSSATRAFAANGFPATDVQMIADDLGLGKGTIYRYFATKEELFLAAVDRGMRRLSESVRVATDSLEDPLEKLVGAVRAYFRFFDGEPELIELLMQERAVFRDRKKPTYIEHRERNIAPWYELLRCLVREGRIRELPVEKITETLSNMCYGTLFTGHFQGREATFEEKVPNILNIVLGGILTAQEMPNLQKYINIQVSQNADN